MEQEIVWKYWNAKKIVECQLFQLKWKILKYLTSPKQRFAWRKLFSLSTDKNFLRLWNKNFWTKIYSNIQTLAFLLLWEFSSRSSRNRAVQMFFLTPTRNMLLAVSWENIFYNVDFVEISNMSEVFWEKLYCKMDDLFC